MKNNNQAIYGELCGLYYDIKEKYASAQEVDFYASFIEPKEIALEVMSGSGRLQIPLLLCGYKIDGVDNSPTMLERCRQRCIPLKLTPLLYEQSLEHIKLEYACYKTVIIAMGSFQLIADKVIALQALQKLRAHMDDNGTILIDIFVPDAATHNKRAQSIARIDDHQVIRCSKRYLFHQQKSRVEALCSYELIIDNIVQKRENELMQFIWYTDDELILLLSKAGFTVVKIHEKTFQTAEISRIIQATTTPL